MVCIYYIVIIIKNYRFNDDFGKIGVASVLAAFVPRAVLCEEYQGQKQLLFLLLQIYVRFMAS